MLHHLRHKNLAVMFCFHSFSFNFPFLLFSLSKSFILNLSIMKRPAPQQQLSSKRPVPLEVLKRPIPGLIGPNSFGTCEEIWAILTEVGIIPKTPLCPHCLPEHVPLPLSSAAKNLHFSIQCSRCRKSSSVLDGTDLFEVKKMRLFFATAQAWLFGEKTEDMVAKFPINKRTCQKYIQIVRNVIDRTLAQIEGSDEEKIGGEGKVVEVDECHLFSRKYGRGRVLKNEKMWVVGLIERGKEGGKRARFLLTEKRGANVLVPFIKSKVKPGTLLISDEWKGYSSELDEDYKRATVNHSKEYGHKEVIGGVEVLINTNHIEREWREVRKVLENRQFSQFSSQLNKEAFRLMFLSNHPKKEWLRIFLEKIGELRK